jgi:hypothetical protein
MGILKRWHMRWQLWGIIAGALAISACTSSTRTLLSTNLPQFQTNYKKVQIFLGAPPRKVRPIAMVTVSRDGENAVWAMEVLKMEAAEIGADAITNVEMNYASGFFPVLRVQGLAVKYE